MKLLRSSVDRQIAGVCGGLVYLALWYFMPEVPPAKPAFEPPPLQPWEKIIKDSEKA